MIARSRSSIRLDAVEPVDQDLAHICVSDEYVELPSAYNLERLRIADQKSYLFFKSIDDSSSCLYVFGDSSLLAAYGEYSETDNTPNTVDRIYRGWTRDATGKWCTNINGKYVMYIHQFNMVYIMLCESLNVYVKRYR